MRGTSLRERERERGRERERARARASFNSRLGAFFVLSLQRMRKAGHLAPLHGKRFFLDDVLSPKIATFMKKELQQLGGVIERFWSKDVGYVITNRKETKLLPECSSQPALAAQTAVKPIHTLLQTSRGKQLVNKVIQEGYSHNLLASARSWGTKVIHVNAAMHYIRKKKKEQVKSNMVATGEVNTLKFDQQKYFLQGSKLKKPFIKVEDCSRLYRPVFAQLSRFPVINYGSTNGHYPIELENKLQAQPKQKPSVDKNSRKNEHRKGRRENCVRGQGERRKKPGYCECCCMKFENINEHLQGEKHRFFVEDSTNYEVLDEIIRNVCESRTQKNSSPSVDTVTVSKIDSEDRPSLPSFPIKLWKQDSPHLRKCDNYIQEHFPGLSGLFQTMDEELQTRTPLHSTQLCNENSLGLFECASLEQNGTTLVENDADVPRHLLDNNMNCANKLLSSMKENDDEGVLQATRADLRRIDAQYVEQEDGGVFGCKVPLYDYMEETGLKEETQVHKMDFLESSSEWDAPLCLETSQSQLKTTHQPHNLNSLETMREAQIDIPNGWYETHLNCVLNADQQCI
uniref:DBF4-type domain-containing protein n=1 Tax=Eptatretus burgeri TaxID=7764 RepID=A0A8C4NFS8_EPTBU